MLAILVVLCFGMMTAAAQAFSVDYQFGATGVYGDVDGTPLSNASFLVSIIGNTQDVVDILNGPVFVRSEITGLTGSIKIYNENSALLYDGSFYDPLYVYVTKFGSLTPDIVGFGSDNSGYEMALYYPLSSPPLWDYYLRSFFGPISAGNGYSGTGLINYLDGGADTTFGLLTVETINAGSFQAVPVPAPVLLLASGLAGLVVIRRRPKS